MTSNFISNNVPVGIGYDSDGAAKGLIELSKISLDNLVMVSVKSDLPDEIGDAITLLPNYAYWFLTEVDLEGCRLVLGDNTAIIGSSSETSKIKSTGLSTSALITSHYTFPMRNITLESDIALDLSAIDPTINNAIDWIAVNFQDCSTVGTIQDYTNVIISDSAFLNSSKLTFDGTVATVGFNGCIFSIGGDETGIILADSLEVSRRFRIIYSAIVAGSPGSLGVSASETATIPTEAYILDTVNFAGGGIYTSGVQFSGVEALWTNCVGVTNSADISNYFMTGNATPTTISTMGVAVKAEGSTTSNSITQKFTNTDNRATYSGGLTRNFKITSVGTLTGANNKQYAISIAKNGVVLPEANVILTTNAGGRAENGTAQGIILMNPSDYVEVWVEGVDTTLNPTMVELNVIVEALN